MSTPRPLVVQAKRVVVKVGSSSLTTPAGGIDPDRINAWWGTRPEIDLRVGGDYVSHHATGDRVVDRIVRLEPPHVLAHTFWQHVNPDALVTYELQPIDEGTLLVLTHEMTEHDLRNAAEKMNWDGDIYDLMSRTAVGWPRLLTKLAASLPGQT